MSSDQYNLLRGKVEIDYDPDDEPEGTLVRPSELEQENRRLATGLKVQESSNAELNEICVRLRDERDRLDARVADYERALTLIATRIPLDDKLTAADADLFRTLARGVLAETPKEGRET